MKRLKPRTIQEYQCDFCSHKYVKQSAGQAHEFKCYKNPERHCLTCDDEGIETFGSLGVSMGFMSDTESRTCSSCLIAEQAGGRSFINKQLG